MFRKLSIRFYKKSRTFFDSWCLKFAICFVLLKFDMLRTIILFGSIYICETENFTNLLQMFKSVTNNQKFLFQC